MMYHTCVIIWWMDRWKQAYFDGCLACSWSRGLDMHRSSSGASQRGAGSGWEALGLEARRSASWSCQPHDVDDVSLSKTINYSNCQFRKRESMNPPKNWCFFISPLGFDDEKRLNSQVASGRERPLTSFGHKTNTVAGCLELAHAEALRDDHITILMGGFSNDHWQSWMVYDIHHHLVYLYTIDTVMYTECICICIYIHIYIYICIYIYIYMYTVYVHQWHHRWFITSLVEPHRGQTTRTVQDVLSGVKNFVATTVRRSQGDWPSVLNDQPLVTGDGG